MYVRLSTQCLEHNACYVCELIKYKKKTQKNPSAFLKEKSKVEAIIVEK